MHLRKRRRQLLLCLAVIVITLGALSAFVYLRRDAIQNTLAHWTGESELRYQLRGTASLLAQVLTRPAPRTDPLVPIAHTGVSPYGVNTFLQLEVEPEKVERSLQLASEAGFRWIRQQG